MTPCPCGSGAEYGECCEPVISGLSRASTPEALMRARYSAFVGSAVEFIHETTHPSQRDQYDRKAVAAWADNSDWLGLDIVRTEGGGPEDDRGIVEFVARYTEKGKQVDHHEIAEFIRTDGTWYFFDGHPPKPTQFVRPGPKVGRNNPCPCGSGEKYKKCCAA
ncbi:MAG: YchJ family protein [Desulfobacterales bacterium]